MLGNVQEYEGYFPENTALRHSDDGYALAFSLSSFVEPSTRTGRRFARPKEGSKILNVQVVTGSEVVLCGIEAAPRARVRIEEVSYLASAGRGVVLIKLSDDDALLAVTASTERGSSLEVKTSLGGTQRITIDKYDKSARGGKGKEAIKRGSFVELVRPEVAAPPLLAEVSEADSNESVHRGVISLSWKGSIRSVSGRDARSVAAGSAGLHHRLRVWTMLSTSDEWTRDGDHPHFARRSVQRDGVRQRSRHTSRHPSQTQEACDRNHLRDASRRRQVRERQLQDVGRSARCGRLW